MEIILILLLSDNNGDYINIVVQITMEIILILLLDYINVVVIR